MSIVADWRFSPKYIYKGSIEEGNLVINDSSNNKNYLELATIGKENVASKYIKWSDDNYHSNKEDKSLEFFNSIKNGEGVYFKTSIESPINSCVFEDGYTIELLYEVPEGKYDPWMGILTREGSGKDINKNIGEPEILTTLSYNDIFQWTGYPLNLDYNPTNWSISTCMNNVRDGFHHVVIVNDGEKTTLYLNGVADIRNPKEKVNGIDCVKGKGWFVGAANWDNKFSSLLTGKLERIRICDKALNKKEWLITKHKPTITLEGSSEKKVLLNKKSNYNFVVIPDSQYMGQANPDMLTSMTKWIAKNKEELNIKMTLHVGDISEESSEIEFINADKYFGILDENNCNYMVTPGNHDYKDKGIKFRKYFGQERFKNKDIYRENSFNDLNMYSIVKAGSLEYLFISLDYYYIKEGVKWAKDVIKENKNKPAIIFTHDCYDVNEDGIKRTRNGEFIWNNLVNECDSIVMVIAGHEFGVRNRVSKNAYSNDVVELLVNYQTHPSGGNGWLRLIEVDEDSKIRFKTYSPWVEDIKAEDRTYYDYTFLTSKDDEFCIDLKLKERCN